jgi:hypothetical protein
MLGLPGVFALEPGVLGGGVESESELLAGASDSDGREDDCVFVPVALAPVDWGAIEGGSGGEGAVYERLEVFAPIAAGAASDEE